VDKKSCRVLNACDDAVTPPAFHTPCDAGVNCFPSSFKEWFMSRSLLLRAASSLLLASAMSAAVAVSLSELSNQEASSGLKAAL
jgi:hypothetical protein